MRQHSTVVTLLLLAMIILAACGGGQAEPAGQAAAPAGDAVKGQELFISSCAACHGSKGEGVQGLGKDMTQSEFIADLSDAELLAFIKVGRDTSDPANTTGVAMPPKGGNPAVTDEQLVDIIAYMRSIHQ